MGISNLMTNTTERRNHRTDAEKKGEKKIIGKCRKVRGKEERGQELM